MPASTQIELIDLRHFNARQLRPLLMEEATAWHQRLRWDYASSTELLLGYLDGQILPGYVALDRGVPVGFSFCVYENSKAVIGDIYVAASMPSRIAISQTLTRHLLEVLVASPDIDRIEAQLLLYDLGTISTVFAEFGFRTYPRLFLERDFAPPSPEVTRISMTNADFAGLELRPWSPEAYEPSAELIRRAYTGHLDSDINDQYQTRDGCLRFLHNIIRFPGCGVFDADSSWTLRDRSTGTLAAILLCSRVDADVAHITQLCLAPSLRARGAGRNLLNYAMNWLALRGYRAITLTVSQQNVPAVRLYRAAGFTTRLNFEALVFDKVSRLSLDEPAAR